MAFANGLLIVMETRMGASISTEDWKENNENGGVTFGYEVLQQHDEETYIEQSAGGNKRVYEE